MCKKENQVVVLVQVTERVSYVQQVVMPREQFERLNRHWCAPLSEGEAEGSERAIMAMIDYSDPDGYEHRQVEQFELVGVSNV